MAYKIDKIYPDNYSRDIISVIDALTLKHGKKPFLIGSGSYKVNFPSDVDAMQDVPVNKNILKDLQCVIRCVLKLNSIFIGDIKSGVCPFLKVVDDDLSVANYPSKRNVMLNRLEKLVSAGCITNEEYTDSTKLLIPKITEMDLYIIKHDIRYEVVRWKAQDILNGFVIYRTHKINFFDNLLTDTPNNLTKIDIICWLNGVRYNEITMVYVLTKNGKSINSSLNDFKKLIIDGMPYLLYKGKYMKIAKRINTIERMSSTPKKSLLTKLYKLFNSDLARLSQVISDIEALQFLIENVKVIPKDKFEFEIDQMKFRLGFMTNNKYLKKEKTIVKLLNEIENDVVNFDLLENLSDDLSAILQSEVLKVLKKYKLFPVPAEYLPSGIEGKGLTKSNLMKEHKRLIKILKTGSKKQQLKEAADQQREMENF